MVRVRVRVRVRVWIRIRIRIRIGVRVRVRIRKWLPRSCGFGWLLLQYCTLGSGIEPN